MWQLASEATNASSGSTALSSESGGRTTCGEAEAAISMPPSNHQRCARLYLPSVKTWSLRDHWTVAV
jgi:hypothetical protein